MPTIENDVKTEETSFLVKHVFESLGLACNLRHDTSSSFADVISAISVRLCVVDVVMNRCAVRQVRVELGVFLVFCLALALSQFMFQPAEFRLEKNLYM